MRINKERTIDEFAALVSIDSPTFGEKQMGEYLKRQLTELGFTVSEDDAGQKLGGNCGNLYGYLEGEISGKPLLFCAHMDTVEPSRGKQAVVGSDGIIRGNGKSVLGADDCAGIVGILEALRTIKEQQIPHRPVEVLFTVAEEAYCKGAEAFDFSKIRSKEAYVLDLSGPVGAAAYQAPSILSFAATVRGKAAHAGFAPESGIHAVAAAAKAISRLDMGRIGQDTTLNVGVMEGGLATNIVPERCVVRGEIRSYSHQKALEQAGHVKKCFTQAAGEIGASAEFQVSCGCEAYETPAGHPVVERFRRACKDLGVSVSLQKTFGGSDNNHLAKHGIVGLVLANAMYQNHSCGEYATLEGLRRTFTMRKANSGNGEHPPWQ